MSNRDVTGVMADHWKAEHDKVKDQRNQLREALERAADDLGMIARVENNYLAKSGAERCRTALKQTENPNGRD